MTTTTHIGDCRAVLATLPEQSVHLAVTSPPYFGLRAYSSDPREIGREQTPEQYIAALVAVFAAVRRVLRDDGVLVLNLGDSFAGSWGNYAPNGITNTQRPQTEDGKRWARRAYDGDTTTLPPTARAGTPKSKLLIPHRVALALQADGWILRQDMPWIKKNAMPESVTDRPTTAHEYVFLLAKSARYFWDADAVRQESSPSSMERAHLNDTAKPPPRSYALVESGDHKGVLSRAKAYGQGRNYRTTDPWFASLDAAIAETRATLAHLEAIKARGGLLTDDDGDPLALQVNPVPYKNAHFAVFPPALVEPFIRAGSPQQCCPTCGAGWVRQVERTTEPDASAKGSRFDRGKTGTNGMGRTQAGERFARMALGFRPACACPDNDGSGRAVVLDPFGGSGTTASVAERLGRDAILIDLNPEYAPLQDGRLNGVQVELPL